MNSTPETYLCLKMNTPHKPPNTRQPPVVPSVVPPAASHSNLHALTPAGPAVGRPCPGSEVVSVAHGGAVLNQKL